MTSKKLTIILILLITVFISLYSQTAPVIELPIEFSNARLAAMGGYHAALTDDVMTILNNPAGFCSLDSELLISELTLGLFGPIFDITGIAISAMNSEVDFMTDMSFLTELATILKGTAGLDLVGPIALAYAGNGISFGLFNWAELAYNYKGGINLENILTENLLLIWALEARDPEPR